MPAKFTNTLDVPELLYDAILNDEYVSRGHISTTSLIDSPRVRLLKRANEYTIDASQMLFALLGKGVHSVLESRASKAGERYLIEHQMAIQVEGWEVTGTGDLYDILHRRLDDYKSTSVWKAMRGVEHSQEWVKQTNIYAYMLRRLGYEVKSIRIIAIMRDWKESKSRYSADYPKSSVITLDIPIWDDEAVLRYITERVKLHQEQEKLFFLGKDDGTVDEKAIEYCTAKERWALPETWRLVPKGKTRSVKNFEIVTEADTQAAGEFIKANKDKNLQIQVSEGLDMRCETYCPVNKFCSYWLSKNPSGTGAIQTEIEGELF